VRQVRSVFISSKCSLGRCTCTVSSDTVCLCRTSDYKIYRNLSDWSTNGSNYCSRDESVHGDACAASKMLRVLLLLLLSISSYPPRGRHRRIRRWPTAISDDSDHNYTLNRCASMNDYDTSTSLLHLCPNKFNFSTISTRFAASKFLRRLSYNIRTEGSFTPFAAQCGAVRRSTAPQRNSPHLVRKNLKCEQYFWPAPLCNRPYTYTYPVQFSLILS